MCRSLGAHWRSEFGGWGEGGADCNGAMRKVFTFEDIHGGVQ